jgi:hypothetical protein
MWDGKIIIEPFVLASLHGTIRFGSSSSLGWKSNSPPSYSEESVNWQVTDNFLILPL